MKRKLSLLMVLMMMLTLVPANMAFAATTAVVDTVVTTADGAPNFEVTLEPDGSGVAADGIFELSLGEDAEFKDLTVRYTTTSASFTLVTNDDGTDDTDRVEVEVSDIPGVPASGKITTGKFVFEGTVQLDGAEEGDQKVTIESINNAGVSRHVLTYAVVSGKGDILSRRLESSETLTRGSEKTGARFELRETDMTSLTAGANKFEMKLPKNMTWNSNTEIDGVKLIDFAGETYADDNRTLIVPIAALNSQIDRMVVKPVIDINKDATKGDVKVSFGQAANDADSIVIGEYVDYGVTVEVDEVKSIVAGRTYADVQDENDYEVEITLDAAGSSFVVGRPIDITVANGDLLITDLEKADGFTSEDFDGDYDGVNAEKTDEFSIEAMAAGDDIVITAYVQADWDATTPVEITVEGGGVEKQTVKIADVVAPAKVTTKVGTDKTVTDVMVGLQNQMAPEITITETQAAALREGLYVIDFAGSRYDGIEFTDSDLDFKTTGDISVDDVTVEEDGKKLLIAIDGESDETAGTIVITGLKVTLDRSVPYGNVDARFGFITSNLDTDKLNADSYKDADDIIEKLPFLNVVTEVQTARQQKTVFTLDSATYTVGSETKTLDAAPYISNNRTMLPIGTVAQLAGATLNYSATTRTAVFTKDNLVVSMNLDTNILLVNGSPVPMDAKPEIVNSRAFVPVVYVAQAFGIQNGIDIVYDAAARTVTLFPNAQ